MQQFMKMISLPLGSRQSAWIFRLVRLFCVSALFIASITPSLVLAQAADDPWTEPLNLSRSGIAMNPAIVIDSDAIVHAVWQDNLAQYVHTRLEGDQWSAPETTDLDRLFMLPTPGRTEAAVHTAPNPLFVAGPNQSIFAFWISTDGKLFRSKVRNQSFGDFAAWESGRLIAPEAASFAVAVDALGELHLAFLRPVDEAPNPAGIYYTRSKNGGSSWAVPELLYESPYLRRLGEGEANLSIATVGTEDAPRVLVAWDNRPRKQVLLAQSPDGGESWEEPSLIAGPAESSGSGDPFNIRVAANQTSVVLVWQSGQPGGACSQIYQSSSDAGATWSGPQPMIEDLLGCAQSNEFVTRSANSPDGPLYFLTETQSQILLSAWNGSQWTEPQEQPILTGFDEPEIFTKVDLGCQRATLLGERLYIIGCDQGVGGDVWLTSRDMEANASSFEPPIWSEPSPVTSDSLEMEAVELLTTDDGLVHVFFSQHHDPAIYYSYWDGELWSHIAPVLQLPDGEAGPPVIAAGPENELFLVAPTNGGALYFSRAISGNAATESRWSPPAQLETGHDGEIGSVDVTWDAAGTISVAYSVPVNESRGIYLVQSKDHGTSWSEPIQVFNGADAGFDLVGSPSLLTMENGFLHMIWKQQSIQGDGVPESLSLFYARSEDGGLTFSEAGLVVDEPVAWREIVTDGKDNLHLLWQPQDTMTTVWDQISFDGGGSWQIPQGLPDVGMTAAITEDPAGRLHLVDAGPGSLGHWFWDGTRWQPQEPLHWSSASQQAGSVALLAAAVNEQGKMIVVLAESTGEGDLAELNLLYSTRTLELPSSQTTTQDVPTQTTLPATLTPATSTPNASSTPATVVETEPTNAQSQATRNQTNDRVSPFTMALIPVALLLLGVLGIVIRRVLRAKDR